VDVDVDVEVEVEVGRDFNDRFTDPWMTYVISQIDQVYNFHFHPMSSPKIPGKVDYKNEFRDGTSNLEKEKVRWTIPCGTMPVLICNPTFQETSTRVKNDYKKRKRKENGNKKP
jgi:hypothetical protein